MKAVVLDGFTLNPGDLSWGELEKTVDFCEIYDYTAEGQILERSRNADVLITNKTPLMADTIAQLPQLKYIGVLATGYNVIDMDAAHKRGIIVTNIPAYSTDSVAQLVFAHLLNIVSQVTYHSDEVKKGRWSQCRDFSFRDKPLIELAGLTFGIMGLGNIGKRVAQIAQVFGMKVIASTSKAQDELPCGVLKVDTETLFRQSDVLSLHVPLNEETQRIINEKNLCLMKPSSILINTSRGGLIDECALAKALNEEKLFAAGLDVLSTEPPTADNPLLTAKNCYITPHYAWATKQARIRLMKIATENLAAFIKGKPQNRI